MSQLLRNCGPEPAIDFGLRNVAQTWPAAPDLLNQDYPKVVHVVSVGPVTTLTSSLEKCIRIVLIKRGLCRHTAGGAVPLSQERARRRRYFRYRRFRRCRTQAHKRSSSISSLQRQHEFRTTTASPFIPRESYRALTAEISATGGVKGFP